MFAELLDTLLENIKNKGLKTALLSAISLGLICCGSCCCVAGCVEACCDCCDAAMLLLAAGWAVRCWPPASGCALLRAACCVAALLVAALFCCFLLVFRFSGFVFRFRVSFVFVFRFFCLTGLSTFCAFSRLFFAAELVRGLLALLFCVYLKFQF